MPTRSGTTRARTIGILLGALLLLGLLPPAADAQSTAAPSVRLVGATRQVELRRTRRGVPLDLGVYVAAVGGDFVVHARKAAYDRPVAATQVDAATGASLRTVPGSMANDWKGLKRFARVEFRRSDGSLAAGRTLPFCPNVYDRQRLSPDGPEISRYPDMGCETWFPFTKGMVWGIDDQWASPLGGSEYDDVAPRIRVPVGTYRVTVRLTAPVATLFQVPARDRVVRLTAVVSERRARGKPHALSAPSGPEREYPVGPERDVPMVARVAEVAEVAPQLLPDLVALPAFDIGTSRQRGRDLLGFATTPWNAGPGPLVVEGFRRPGTDVMDAVQFFYDADGNAVGRAPAGGLHYHDTGGHNHWHFLQLARYELLDVSRQRVVKSGKQGFCIVPTDAIDLTLPGADLRPWDVGRASVCGGARSFWVREALNPGWGDTYYQNVSGQAFNITGVPNGAYFIRVTLNPQNTLHERTARNNVMLRRVILRGRPGARSVNVLPWRGVIE